MHCVITANFFLKQRINQPIIRLVGKCYFQIRVLIHGSFGGINGTLVSRPVDATTVETWDALEKWAADDFRSVNGQIEWIVHNALKNVGRIKSIGRQSKEKQ